MAIFLEEVELRDAYNDASQSAEQWTKPFSEYERIANNLPSPNLPESYPQVTDGTLAALVAETPMRTWAQLQTGRAVPLDTGGEDFKPWKTEMVNILWANKIIPNANTQAPFFSKLQTSQYRSLIYGSQPFYSFQVSKPGYVGSDFVLPYIKDVKLEPGKVSDRDSDYLFLDTYHTKLQVKGLIKLAESDKEHKTGWNPEVLKELYDSNAFTGKDAADQSSTEQDKQSYSKTAKLVTVFHRGHQAPFYTFIPQLENKIARIQENKNLAGDTPINFIYNQQDLINPYGRGQIELAGPTQNMIDFLMAAFGLATQQGLEPPLKISGTGLESSGLEWDTLNYSPGNPMIVGTAQVELMNPTTNVYNQFATNSGIFKTQVMNLQGSSDASVSSTSGNPQYSKTPAGVKYQQERTNAKDNFLRQRADEAVSQLAKNLINLTLSNLEGSEFIKLSDQQKEKLVKAGKDVPEDDHKVLVEFKELKGGEFNFDVDANSSVVKNDDDTKDRLIELIKTLVEIPDLANVMAQENKQLHIGELIKDVLATSGIDDWEKVISDLDPEDVAAMDEMALQQDASMIEQPGNDDPQAIQMQDAPVDESMPIQEEVEPEQPLDDDPQAEMIELLEAGYDQDTVAVILLLRRNGWDDSRIQEYLEKEMTTESEEQ